MMAFCPEQPKWDQNPKFTPLSETTSIPNTFICGFPLSPFPGLYCPGVDGSWVNCWFSSLFWEIFPRLPLSPSPLSSNIDQHPKFHVRSGSEEKYKVVGLSGSSWNFQVSPSQKIRAFTWVTHVRIRDFEKNNRPFLTITALLRTVFVGPKDRKSPEQCNADNSVMSALGSICVKVFRLYI